MNGHTVSPVAPGPSQRSPFSDTQLEDVPLLLNRSLKIIEDLGKEYTVYGSTIQSLASRLAEGRFQLAVLGQFKRGKSTLLNAILGEEILPSSVIPLTSIPTFIRYGEQRSVHVHYQGDIPEEIFPSYNANWMNKTLLGYVSEELNPRNVKKVSYVEITHPTRILKDVVFIDTPGIGSTHRHNTEMTLNFLPQVDAALFMVSADPPITEVEVEFLKQVRENVARVFFVLNKIDYLSESERETATTFLEKVLSESIGSVPNGRIFRVSAKQALRAKEQNDPDLLIASGLPRITEHLINFLARDKNHVLKEAVGRKALDVLSSASLQVNLELRSLELPLADLEERLATFRKKIDEAQLQRQHARDILSGDRNRVVTHLEEDAGRLRAASQSHLEAIAASVMAQPGEFNPKAVQEAIAREIPVYFEHVLGETTRAFDREVTIVLSAHQEKAAALVESIRVTASEIFDIPHHVPGDRKDLVLAREPYWVSRKSWSGPPDIIPPDLIEKALPRSLREQRTRARIRKEIADLAVYNVENLRWAILQNIDAAFRAFTLELDEDLANAIEATHGAIVDVHVRRKEHAGETAERTGRLDAASSDLQRLISAFTGPGPSP